MIKSVKYLVIDTHSPTPFALRTIQSIHHLILRHSVTPRQSDEAQSTATSRWNVLVSNEEIRQTVKYWISTRHSPSPFVLCAVQSLSHFVRIHSGTPCPVMDDTFAFPLHSDVQSNAKMAQIPFALTRYSRTLSAAASAHNYYSESSHTIYI